MIKLEVIQNFTYSKYKSLINIESKDLKQDGCLYVGDIISVSTKEEADYLCGNNIKNLVACRLYEEKIVETTEEKPKKRKKTK